MTNSHPDFQEDSNGFLKQIAPQQFTYSKDYCRNQSTSSNMSWLRLGFLMGNIDYDVVRHWNVVDVGAGNGTFVKEAVKVFKRVVPYDVVGDTITDEELYSTHWSLIVLSDVIEHFSDVEHLWDFKFDHALISFPELPSKDVMLSLEAWRHFKKNEHLYLLTKEAVIKWVEKHGYKVIASGCPEDAIRTRWHPDTVNISTVLISKT